VKYRSLGIFYVTVSFSDLGKPFKEKKPQFISVKFTAIEVAHLDNSAVDAGKRHKA
jgi:hypothetical protein